MGARQQTRPGVETGAVLDETDRPRIAQNLGGGLYSNLTDTGARIHDIEKGTPLTLKVCEHGIWISIADD